MDKLEIIEFKDELAEEECSICLEKFNREEELSKSTLCPHIFHTKCIQTWVAENPNCPKCRVTFSEAVPDEITRTVIEPIVYALDRIIDHFNRGEVITFSEEVITFSENGEVIVNYFVGDEEEFQEEPSEDEEYEDDIDNLYYNFYGSAYN